MTTATAPQKQRELAEFRPTPGLNFALSRRTSLYGEIMGLVKAATRTDQTVSEGSIREFARQIAAEYIELPQHEEEGVDDA